jgi:hypothetical protein
MTTSAKRGTLALVLCLTPACGASDPGSGGESEEGTPASDVGAGAEGLTAAGVYAFAFVKGTGVVDPDFAHNDGGGAVHAARTSTGVYTVTFDGLTAGGGGNVQVVSVVDPFVGVERCKVAKWSGTTVTVVCHGTTGAPANAGFTVQYVRRSANAVGAYLLADSPTSASYTAKATYSWNSTGVANAVTRSQKGFYAVVLPGVGADGGWVQTTAFGTTSNYCKAATWSRNLYDELVYVLCFDTKGALADTPFTLSYGGDGQVALQDYGAYLFDGTPDTVTVGSAPYSFSSGGAFGTPCKNTAGSSTADPRDGGGVYGEYNVFHDALPYKGTVTYVSAFGFDANFCTIDGSWDGRPSGDAPLGASVQLACFTPDGRGKNTSFFETHWSAVKKPRC